VAKRETHAMPQNLKRQLRGSQKSEVNLRQSANHYTVSVHPRSSRHLATETTGAYSNGLEGGKRHRSLKTNRYSPARQQPALQSSSHPHTESGSFG
jgi:hypothetical protein